MEKTKTSPWTYVVFFIVAVVVCFALLQWMSPGQSMQSQVITSLAAGVFGLLGIYADDYLKQRKARAGSSQ